MVAPCAFRYLSPQTSDEKNSGALELLVDDVIIKILKQLPLRDTILFCSTCRRFRRLLSTHLSDILCHYFPIKLPPNISVIRWNQSVLQKGPYPWYHSRPHFTSSTLITHLRGTPSGSFLVGTQEGLYEMNSKGETLQTVHNERIHYLEMTDTFYTFSDGKSVFLRRWNSKEHSLIAEHNDEKQTLTHLQLTPEGVYFLKNKSGDIYHLKKTGALLTIKHSGPFYTFLAVQSPTLYATCNQQVDIWKNGEKTETISFEFSPSPVNGREQTIEQCVVNKRGVIGVHTEWDTRLYDPKTQSHIPLCVKTDSLTYIDSLQVDRFGNFIVISNPLHKPQRFGQAPNHQSSSITFFSEKGAPLHTISLKYPMRLFPMDPWGRFPFLNQESKEVCTYEVSWKTIPT